MEQYRSGLDHKNSKNRMLLIKIRNNGKGNIVIHYKNIIFVGKSILKFTI